MLFARNFKHHLFQEKRLQAEEVIERFKRTGALLEGHFVLSSGPADVTVPSVTCQPLGSALAELQHAGLEGQPVGTVAALPQCPNPVNVAQQNPAAGTAVPASISRASPT